MPSPSSRLARDRCQNGSSHRHDDRRVGRGRDGPDGRTRCGPLHSSRPAIPARQDVRDGRPGRDVDLVQDALHVVPGGVGTDREGRGKISIGGSLREKQGHFRLPLERPRISRSVREGVPLARTCEETSTYQVLKVAGSTNCAFKLCFRSSPRTRAAPSTGAGEAARAAPLGTPGTRRPARR